MTHNEHTGDNPSGNTRRRFLGAAGAVLMPAAQRVLGANDRINVGLIGVGGKGFQHLRNIASRAAAKGDLRIAAIAEIYSVRKEKAREAAKLESAGVHSDYRDLLARREIDAVVIATPDHWHARQAIDALAAGKDVYLEKPISYTIAEAREIAAQVKRTNRILQVGSQHVSDLLYHRAREVIRKGWIGKVVWAQASCSRNSIEGEWNYPIEPEGTPQSIDWKAFLGPAPKRPFSAERYFRWRKYWDYSGGIATDLMYHRLAPLQFAIGPDLPERVSGQGGIYIHKDREVPDTFASTIEYPGHQIVIASSMASAGAIMPTVIYGHEASIRFPDGGIHVIPEPPYRNKFREATGATELRLAVEQKEDIRVVHLNDFFDCIRSRKQPVFDAELGYKVMAAIRLGVDAYRKGRMMRLDEA